MKKKKNLEIVIPDDVPPKRRGGRPTKLTLKFLEVADQVLNDDINAIILTDEELRFLINERLEEEEKVSDARWEAWKAGELKDPICQEFRGLMKKALLRQKSDLFIKMRTDDKVWVRWAWIIERKFGDWNLRNLTELTGKNGEAINIKRTIFDGTGTENTPISEDSPVQ